MDMDWTSMFGGERAGGAVTPRASEDPVAWLEHELEADKDLCYLQVAPAHWRAKALRKASIISVDVLLDEEGFLVVEADSGIAVPAECERSFRTFQMIENGTFKTAGYRMAKAGENVVFRVILRPDDDISVETLVGRCVFTLADQGPTFRRLAAGEPIDEVHAKTKVDQFKRVLAARRLSKGEIDSVEDLIRLQEAFS